jgi:hypothetical protein
MASIFEETVDEADNQTDDEDGLQSFTPLSTPNAAPSLDGPLNGTRRINYECFVISRTF